MRTLSGWALALACAFALAGCRSIVLSPSLTDDMDIPAHVLRPEGGGRYPIVLLLAPCTGTASYMVEWAHWLQSHGYGAAIIDSYTPRMSSNGCEAGASPAVEDVALDAVATMRGLALLPWADPERFAVMGWSHGGSAALEVDALARFYQSPGVRAVVSLYPGCETVDPASRVPTLLLLGGQDDWTPPGACMRTAYIMQRRGLPVDWNLYPEATHGFDQPGPMRIFRGYHIGHDGTATSDAHRRVLHFLSEQFGAKR